MINPAKAVFDSLFNLITRMGTAGDPSTATQWAQKTVSDQELEFAYSGDWLARKIIDAPANDATREWRAWQAPNEDIEALEDEEKRLGVQRKVRRGLKLARLYGGAGLVMGIRNQLPGEELDPESVGQGDLEFLHVIPRTKLVAGNLITNLMSPLFGEPEKYTVNTAEGQSHDIHPSRVIRLIGDPPAEEGAATSQTLQGWGQSVLIAIDEALKAYGVATQGAAAMLHDAKVDVIKIPQLSQQIATDEYQGRMTSRFAYAALMKNQFGFLLMDKEEEWQRISQSFTQIPELVRVFMMNVGGASDIPATRLFGQSPQGLNATGDGDLQNYYDRLGSEQENDITPAMDKLDEVLIRSALGSRDPSIYYEWNELYGMSEQVKVETFWKLAQGIKVIADAALVPDEVLAQTTQTTLVEMGVLPGLEQALEDMENGLLSPDISEPEPALIGPNGLPVAGNENEPGVARPTAAAGEARRTATGDRRRARRIGAVDHSRHRVRDAQPRTLYVRRDVLNGEEIVRWAKGEGFPVTIPAEQLHVTLMFSRAPVDWMKAGSGEGWSNEKNGEMLIPPGGPRLVERLGNFSVLLFASSYLTWRHQEILHQGASWDWEDYQPHVSISSDPTIRIDAMTPYRGAIRLGPEIFEEVNEEWKQKIVEDKGWRQ